MKSTQKSAGIKSRKHDTTTLSRLHLAALATLAVPLALHAESVPDEPQKLPEVVVGATRASNFQTSKSANEKFTAPLLDTPKSVTVITSEVISQTGAVSLTDALRTVPGITIGAGEGGNPVGDNLFIRGYNAQTDTYIDGIRDTGSQSREIFDLEQIEVVKGPNSAYGGRSSAGGGINLVSKSPKAENFSNASLGVGSAQYRRGTADINRVINDDVAVRLNVMGHDAHVAGRNEVNGNRWGIAPSIALGMQSSTKATLSYYHMQSDELPDTGIPFNNPFTTTNVSKNGNGTPISVPRDTFYGLVDRDFRKTKSDIGTIDVRHDFADGMVLRNVIRYGKTDNDYVWTQPDDSKGNTMLYGTVWRRANTRVTSTDSLANATSLTGSFTAAGIKHSYTTGVEISREDTDRSSYLFSPGTNNPVNNAGTACPTSGAATLYNCTTTINPNPNDPWAYTRTISPARTGVVTNTRSAYAFDTVEFTPQWLLNVGVRWDDYRSVLDVPMYTLNGATTAASHAEVKSNFTNYQAGLVYKPSTNSSIYASFGTSSTPPGNDGGDGLDSLSSTIQNLKPQDSKNYELGTKWEVLPGGRLSLSAAVFESEMNNARVTAPDGTTQNVGKKTMKGIELGVSGNLTKEWQVFGGYTYLDGKVDDNGSVNVGTTAVPNWQPSPYNGNVFPTTPKNSASLWTSYSVLPGVVVGGGLNYVSKVYANINNTKYAPGYTRFDAMASYDVNRHISLQLNVQNLTDKLYFDKVSSPHYAGVGPGRSATLTANFKY